MGPMTFFRIFLLSLLCLAEQSTNSKQVQRENQMDKRRVTFSATLTVNNLPNYRKSEINKFKRADSGNENKSFADRKLQKKRNESKIGAVIGNMKSVSAVELPPAVSKEFKEESDEIFEIIVRKRQNLTRLQTIFDKEISIAPKENAKSNLGLKEMKQDSWELLESVLEKQSPRRKKKQVLDTENK